MLRHATVLAKSLRAVRVLGQNGKQAVDALIGDGACEGRHRSELSAFNSNNRQGELIIIKSLSMLLNIPMACMLACLHAGVVAALRSDGSQAEAVAVEACLVLQHLSADEQGSIRLASLGACEGRD